MSAPGMRSLLVCCAALTCATAGEPFGEGADAERDVLSQLLGDYAKVRAVSEGSDCTCKCVVRPLSRHHGAAAGGGGGGGGGCRPPGECEGGAVRPDHSYALETVSRGSGCKCACIAPPSALDPCEADLRLEKLRDAGLSGLQLSAMMELLEYSVYGMDLLKLHSLTTKLLNRVENLEKQAVSGNHMKETVNLKETSSKEQPFKESQSHQHANEEEEEEKQQQQQQRVGELGDVAAAFVRAEKKYEGKFVGNHGFVLPQLKRSWSSAPVKLKRMLEEQRLSKRTRARPPGAVVRGMTFYKSNAVEEADPEEHPEAEVLSGDGSVDLLIEEELLEYKVPTAKAQWSTKPGPTRLTQPASTEPAAVTMLPEPQPAYAVGTPSNNTEAPAATLASTTPATSPAPANSGTATVPGAPNIATGPSVPAAVATAAPATAASGTGEPGRPRLSTSPATPTRAPPRPRSGKSEHSVGWTESPSRDGEQRAPTETPGECKDTLATIAEPVTHNTYGRSEGAWMKDPGAQDDKIYVTNYYYGNNLLEFQNMEVFKQGRFTNSYKLPYNWIGTGHVVYNGAFFYNRAFSRDIIKFDLRRRYVAAWSMLRDAVFEEAAPWRWRGHSDIDFAVDESGLWVVYPAMDEEGYHQEVIMLSKLNAADLTIEEAASWRTGLRKNFYGNCFVVCGVLYAVDKYDQMNANISYAFDTHTHTQMVPRLPFVNSYNHTTQIDYNPKDHLLYAWDNGHQLTYNVIFAYGEDIPTKEQV